MGVKYATTIQRGVQQGRKYRGMGWVLPNYPKAHTTIRCRVTHSTNRDRLRRVPLFEEDGQLKMMYEHREITVVMCDHCPAELDHEWKEQAACRDGYPGIDMFTVDPVERERLITEVCGVCPVVVDCLNYGLNTEADNVGGIWGGIYFYPTVKARKAAIAERKLQLDIGGVQ